MSGHTPGPWMLDELDNFVYAGEVLIAEVTLDGERGTGPGTECGELNARLIAAAPELLALLIECKPHLESLEDSGPLHEGWQSEELIGLVERVRAAIARAGGGEGG